MNSTIKWIQLSAMAIALCTQLSIDGKESLIDKKEDTPAWDYRENWRYDMEDYFNGEESIEQDHEHPLQGSEFK